MLQNLLETGREGLQNALRRSDSQRYIPCLVLFVAGVPRMCLDFNCPCSVTYHSSAWSIIGIRDLVWPIDYGAHMRARSYFEYLAQRHFHPREGKGRQLVHVVGAMGGLTGPKKSEFCVFHAKRKDAKNYPSATLPRSWSP